MVNPDFGHRDHVAGHIFNLSGVDQMGGAKLARRFSSLGHGIGNEDLARPGESCSLYDRHADAAESHDKHGVAFGDVRRIERGAHAGLNRTAQDTRNVQGDIVGDLDCAC